MFNKNQRLTRALSVKRMLAISMALALMFAGSALTTPASAAFTPDTTMYFSSLANTNVAGLGSGDDADIYSYDGATYTRVFDASTSGLPGGADIDALHVVDSDTFYMSFTAPINPGGIGTVDDSDVALYDGGAWSLHFDGSDVGLTTAGEDIDSLSILADGSVVVSTLGVAAVSGLTGIQNADLIQCTGTFGSTTVCSWSEYFDGSDISLSTSAENVAGFSVTPAAAYFTTTAGYNNGSTFTSMDEDVFECVAPATGSTSGCTGALNLYYDGSTAAPAFTGDVDAVSVIGSSSPTLPQAITFGPLADQAIDAGDFTLGATSDSGLPVEYSTTGGCSVAGDLLTMTAIGLCTVTASQPGDGTYLPAAAVDQSFTITPGGQTITFGPLPDRVDAETNIALLAVASSGLPVSYTAVGQCTVLGNIMQLTGVGSCDITADQAGDANYSAAAPVTQSFTITAFSGIEIYAETGSMTLPGAGSVPVWGYGFAAGSVTKTGGPDIIVNQGDVVEVLLHNNLSSQDTGLLFAGQPMTPDLTGASAGGTAFYRFTADRPGTFLYEAALLPGAQYQSAMGLHGALIVRPSGSPGQAYGDVNTAFDQEATLVLAEIDTALNGSASPEGFDMREFDPSYYTINGEVFPDTDEIVAPAGADVLLRYVNAGTLVHTMALLGGHQELVGLGGNPVGFGGRSLVAEAFGPGQSADAIVTMPAATSNDNRLAVYDSSLLLNNGSQTGFGGMLTYLRAPGSGGVDDVGPLTTGLTFAAGTLDATTDDSGMGGANIAAAEYFLDTVGAPGSGTAMLATDAAFDSPSEAITVSGVVTGSGPHILYVRGQDALGNWGPVASVNVNGGDDSGPETTGLSLDPNPSSGSTDVALSGTGNDSASGGSNIAAAEYTIDAGPPVAMTVNAPSPVASIDGVIPTAVLSGLADGAHVVSVRSQDAAGNWGDPTTIDLVIDTDGPVVTSEAASPNPNNGSIPFNPTTQAVRVTATFSDASNGGATIAAGEGYLDAGPTPALGSGFVFIAADGAFDEVTEDGFVDIPLTTVAQLSPGAHEIAIRTQDSAGNWGPLVTFDLIIDPNLVLPGLYFSTLGAVQVPGVSGPPPDDSDIYFWNTAVFSRLIDANADPAIPLGANVDGVSVVSPTEFYVSFVATVTLPGVGTVADEDVAYFNNGVWTMFYDGSANGLVAARDLDAISVVGSTLYFSTRSNGSVPGISAEDNADVYRWDGGSAYTKVFDATANSVPGSANVDGLNVVDLNNMMFSFVANHSIDGNSVRDEDVAEFNLGSWSIYFDGSAEGLTIANQDIDALDIQ